MEYHAVRYYCWWCTENGLGIFVSASKDRRGNYSYKDIDGDVKTMPNSGFNTDGVNLKLDQQIGKDNREES